MKTTLDIHDELLMRAKRHAKNKGKPLRAIVEEGIRLALSEDDAPPKGYKLPDMSAGAPDGPDPLETYSWPV